MDETKTARGRGRRITLEIPDSLYARLALTKSQTRKSLSALAEEGLRLVADHYASQRRQARDAAAPPDPSS